MKSRYPLFSLTDEPTLEERLLFFEKGIREIATHELLCESRRPHIEKTGFWSKTTTFPYPCDCWLSYPLGSVGLRPNPKGIND